MCERSFTESFAASALRTSDTHISQQVLTSIDAELFTGAGGVTALPAQFTISAQDADLATITGNSVIPQPVNAKPVNAKLTTPHAGINSVDELAILVSLHTGDNGTDASLSTTLGAASDQTALLPALARTSGAAIQNGLAVFNDTLALSLTGIAGRYFKLVFTLEGYPDITVSSTTFQVSPAAFKVGYGAASTDYDAPGFPYVVRLDGNASDSPNVDGLPSSLTVSLMGDASTVLSKAACSACMIARLVKCDGVPPRHYHYQNPKPYRDQLFLSLPFSLAPPVPPP